MSRHPRSLVGRASCALVALALAPVSTGCATLAHETGLFAWWDTHTETKREQKNVVVTSEPQGVKVARRAADGLVPLGVTPLVDVVPFETDVKRETPKTAALWVGAALEATAGLALMVVGITGSDDAGGIDVGRFLAGGLGGGLLVTSASVDAIVALVHGGTAPRVTAMPKGGEQTYVAEREGSADVVATVRLPEQASAHLVLAAPELPRTALDPSWVVAVMGIEDVQRAKGAPIADPELVDGLGDQLRVQVARRGVRTIDRGAQETALKQQLTRLKTESYASCFDSACQVELGKALAASHILRTRLARFGARCVLSGELIELRTEVAVHAGSAQGPCEPEGLLQLGESVARELLGPR
ncbi:hypothetical protein L6R52_23485 [Myxococcota bacterium]|nr:hypothetical protein [Myxococcota bacterium]